jgi:hypothetical protein
MLENVYVLAAVFAGIAYVTLYQSRTLGVLLVLAFILTMTRVTEHLTANAPMEASTTPSPNTQPGSIPGVTINLGASTTGVTSGATTGLAPSSANQPIPTTSNTPTAPAVPPPATAPPNPVDSKTTTPAAPAKPRDLASLQKRAADVERDLVYLQGLGLNPATNDTLRDRLAEKIDLDKSIQELGGSKVETAAPKKIYAPLPPIPMPSLGPTPVLEYFGGFR